MARMGKIGVGDECFCVFFFLCEMFLVTFDKMVTIARMMLNWAQIHNIRMYIPYIHSITAYDNDNIANMVIYR